MINGKLEAFWETGTEGVIWSLYDNNEKGYESLHCLKDGDYLEVYNDDGSIHWKGDVKLEYKRRYRPFPMNPQYGQQEVFGMWVHGFQDDIEPEFWAKMFFDAKKAAIRKKEKE
jgi:hypothetical protein